MAADRSPGRGIRGKVDRGGAGRDRWDSTKAFDCGDTMRMGNQDDESVDPEDGVIDAAAAERSGTAVAGEGDLLCRGVADLMADAGVEGAVRVAARNGFWFDVRVTLATGGDTDAARGVVAELDAIFRGAVGQRWYDCKDCGSGPGELAAWYEVRPVETPPA